MEDGPLDLPFKRLSPTARAPEKAFEHDAAYDLFADHDAWVGVQSTVIETNLALAIPRGYGGLIMGRSGLAKKSIHPLGFVLDSPDGTVRLGGVIDQYRGPIKVMLASIGAGSPAHHVQKGEAIAQIWILPIPRTRPVDVGDGELPPSDRGEDGFGSSDERRRYEQQVGRMDRAGPGPALSSIVEVYDRAIRSTARESARMILEYPRPAEMTDDDYRRNLESLVERAFRHHFRTSRTL